MLARKKLKLFILVKHYIRLFKSFFRGFYNDFNLVWDSVNSSFYLRVKQSIFLSYTTNTYLKLALNFLKLNSLDQLQILVDLVANQFTLNKSPLYFITYLLLSPRFNYRFKVILCLMGNPLSRFAPSVVKVFYNANWLEREAWDLFGIIFKGHPDLRGILTDYGFKGHPLQKDFPLVGLVDSFYSDSEKRVLYLPLELSQAPRVFLQKTIRP